MNMQINPDIFEARLKEAIKPEPLKNWCERVGVNLATLNSAFQRKAVPKVELLVQVASITGRSIDWLIGFSDEDRRFQAAQPTGHNVSAGHDQNWAEFVQVPLYKVKASAGHGAQIDREDVEQYLAFRRDFLYDRLRISGNGLYCVKVTGVSMEPILRDGNPVLIEPTGGEVLYEGPHLLRLEGALLLKNLQRLPGGRLRIWSENHLTNAYQPIEVDWPPREGVDLQVFGRVRWSDNVF
jgi:phage repressor protein C with HTH and peptisase S24 domain